MARYRTRILERTIDDRDQENLFIKAYISNKFLPKDNRSLKEIFESTSEERRKEIISQFIKSKPSHKA